MSARVAGKFLEHIRGANPPPVEEELTRSNEFFAAYNKFNKAADDLRTAVKAALGTVEAPAGSRKNEQ